VCVDRQEQCCVSPNTLEPRIDYIHRIKHHLERLTLDPTVRLGDPDGTVRVLPDAPVIVPLLTHVFVGDSRLVFLFKYQFDHIFWREMGIGVEYLRAEILEPLGGPLREFRACWHDVVWKRVR